MPDWDWGREMLRLVWVGWSGVRRVGGDTGEMFG